MVVTAAAKIKILNRLGSSGKSGFFQNSGVSIVKMNGTRYSE
jgi:hypothetical protein